MSDKELIKAEPVTVNITNGFLDPDPSLSGPEQFEHDINKVKYLMLGADLAGSLARWFIGAMFDRIKKGEIYMVLEKDQILQTQEDMAGAFGFSGKGEVSLCWTLFKCYTYEAISEFGCLPFRVLYEAARIANPERDDTLRIFASEYQQRKITTADMLVVIRKLKESQESQPGAEGDEEEEKDKIAKPPIDKLKTNVTELNGVCREFDSGLSTEKYVLGKAEKQAVIGLLNASIEAIESLLVNINKPQKE